ncbi:hypothetical protein ACLKA6_014653 [Drosophila palustris]
MHFPCRFQERAVKNRKSRNHQQITSHGRSGSHECGANQFFHFFWNGLVIWPLLQLQAELQFRFSFTWQFSTWPKPTIKATA